MKLPLLWIVAAFAAGILLTTESFGLVPMRPMVWLAFAAATLLASAAFLRRRWLHAAWMLGLAGWMLLGAFAARLEQLDIPPNHVTRLLADGAVDTSEPLRWHGRLREDPSRMPWGARYDVDLDEVEAHGNPIPVVGGLRVDFYNKEVFQAESEQSAAARPRGQTEAGPELRAGDRVEVLVRARPPRNYGNPGAFDFRAQLARQNIHLAATLRSLKLLTRIAQPPPTLAHRLARLRAQLLARLDAFYSATPERAAVLRAMLLGDRTFVDRERTEEFQKSATYHVLVLAGLHVAALVAFVFWAGKRLRLGPFARTLITLAMLATYVSIVEERPPILRAALMAGVFLCGWLLYRRIELLNSLAFAALILLVARPSTLNDPSFQLSLLAIASIGALAVPWMERTTGHYLGALQHVEDVTRDGAHPPRAIQFRLDVRAAARWLASRLPPRLAPRAASFAAFPCSAALRVWEIVVLSVVIQLGMLPLLAYYLHRVSLSGPFANVPAVLLTGLIVPLGFATLSLSYVWSKLGSLLAKLLGALVGILVACVDWFSRWNWASYRIPGPPLLELCVFLAAAILLAIALRSGQRLWQVAALVPLLFLTLAVATYPFAPRLEQGKLEVTLLDVGQGDSIFTAFPDGRTMLIDGGGLPGAARIGGMRTGPDVGESAVSPYLWSRGLKRLDVVSLTHAHYDHLGGLGAVLGNFRVRELWLGRDVSTATYRALLEIARRRGVRVVHHMGGEEFSFDGVIGQFLWPDTIEEVRAARNNDSLVLRLTYGREALLLPGDIESAVERRLGAQDPLLPADFLKVAHHGSKTSTSSEWIARVAPRVAAISVGENNPFGHPHPEVLERLRAAGVRVLRTDRDGAITLTTDGQSLRVRSFHEAR